MTSTATPRNEFHPRGQPEFHDQHGLHRRISLKKHLARERLIVGMDGFRSRNADPAIQTRAL